MFDIKVKAIENTEHQNDGTFLQTPFWCQFKSRHGWSYRRFEVQATMPDLFKEDEADCGHSQEKSKNASDAGFGVTKTMEVSVLNRSFAKGMFSIAYIPLFPKLPYQCTPEEVLDKALADSDSADTDDSAPQISIINQELVTPETQSIEFAHYLRELADALKPQLPKNTIAIRFDPDVSFSSPEDRDFFNFGIKTISYADHLHLKKNKVDIQPQSGVTTYV